MHVYRQRRSLKSPQLAADERRGSVLRNQAEGPAW